MQFSKFSNQTALVFFLHPLLHYLLSALTSGHALAEVGPGKVVDGDMLGGGGADLELRRISCLLSARAQAQYRCSA